MPRSKLEIAKDLYKQTYSVDISNIDGKKRNARCAQALLQSYSRNICTLAETKTIVGDILQVAHLFGADTSENILIIDKEHSLISGRALFETRAFDAMRSFASQKT